MSSHAPVLLGLRNFFHSPQPVPQQRRDLSMEDQQSPLIDEIVNALRRPLEDPYPLNSSGEPRAPNKFDTKLKEACTSRERDVLLDTGFQAWFAYIQAERRAQFAFERLPRSEAKIVAHHLCTIKPHPTVEALFQHTLHGAFRAPARRAQLQDSNYCNFPGYQGADALECTRPGSAASIQSQVICEPQPMYHHARQNNSDQQHGTSSGSAASGQLQNTGEPQPMDVHRRQDNAEQEHPLSTNTHPNNSNSMSTTHNTRPGIRLPPIMNALSQSLRLHSVPDRSPDMEELPPAERAPETYTGNHSWAFPKSKNIPSLLPHQTCTSVIKSDSLATIRMVFGDTPSQCHLEIDVYAQKIPYIARELFGTIFEIEDGRLSMKLVDSGASATFEKLTLCGADRTGTERLFGKVFQFVKADPLYANELENGEPVSSLISLDIRGKTGDPSCLKIRSTAQTMSIIAKKLWPEFPFFS